jgi:hypothetical protein
MALASSMAAVPAAISPLAEVSPEAPPVVHSSAAFSKCSSASV